MDQKPSIGRVVIYNLNESDAAIAGTPQAMKGAPAVIVCVHSETCVNLKVLTDGFNDLWKTSVIQGDGLCQWNWPPRV